MLAGDLNKKGGDHLCEDPSLKAKMDAHIFKTPHHGSHDFYFPFLEAVRPQISVISSGDYPDHGHPRANFLGAVGLASRSKAPLVFSTEIAANFTDATEIDLRDILDDDTIDETEYERGKLFKRNLHGMINVRTDGKLLYAARRVQSGYWWEAYGEIPAEDFPSLLSV